MTLKLASETKKKGFTSIETHQQMKIIIDSS